MRRLAAIALGVLVCTGCAETTLIRSQPPGATLWVNDVMVGATPVEYTCSRAEFAHPQRFRLELQGYQPAEGELRRRVMPGRIVGGCFSLGISLLFKRPTGFRNRYDFALVPRPRAITEPAGAGAPERGAATPEP